MGQLENCNVLMVIAPKEFRDEEYIEPRKILEGEGCKITVASTRVSACVGKFGMKVSPDILIEDVKSENYDAIIFVGGPGSIEYFGNPIAHKLAQEFNSQGKIVAAICIAPVILARAGILKGKKVSVYMSEVEAVRGRGAYVTKNPVEVTENIITANGPESATSFGEAISKALKDKGK